MEATQAYIGILDAYGLSEAQLPLLKVIRPALTLTPNPNPTPSPNP